METEEILLEIIMNGQSMNVISRARSELKRDNHRPDSLWRLYRMALAEEADGYSIEALEAMRAHDRQMSARQAGTKTALIQIRMTENEVNIIRLNAQRHGMSLSEFVRTRCMNGEGDF